jgi:hypothetical protein
VKDRRATPRPRPGPGERSALDDLVHRLHGTASLLDIIAQHASMPQRLQTALSVLFEGLNETAHRAEGLAEESGIDLSSELGITTDDLATMSFVAAVPSFQRTPADLGAWLARAEQGFADWGEVERILGQDDIELETMFMQQVPSHMKLVERLEAMHSTAQADTKLLEAALLRLAVAVARKEKFEE